MDEPRWEHFPHLADIGVRGFGPSLAAAFGAAAVALQAIVTDPATLAADTSADIACAAPDHVVLLVDWLNALIFEMATRRMLFSRFDVMIDDRRLIAKAWGEQVRPALHQPAVEPKGATFSCAAVEQDADGTWCVQCVVDV